MIGDRLVAFGRAMRDHGLPCGTTELIDAANALAVLGYDDRERMRAALAASLLRRAEQRRLFDDLFDVYFPRAVGEGLALGPTASVGTDPADRRAAAARLRDELARALASGDRRQLEQLAARAVAELGRLSNDATMGSFSAAQALDTLTPQTAIAAALAQARDAGEVLGGSGEGSGGTGESGPSGTGGAPAGSRSGAPPLDFTRDELRARVAEFRRAVETETRRRNAQSRGTQRISRYAVRQSADRVPFQLAGAVETQELRRTIEPLARKLATRIAARRRRASHGAIDLRRTLRRSLATGGVPVAPAYRHPPPRRPDLVLLCDLSQSVSGFSRFTILLVQALANQFRRVRIFGFVNVVEELTEAILDAPPGSDLSAEFNDTSRMTRYHANSDYGSALADFTEHHLDAVGPRSVVLILGDARTNHTDPHYDELRRIVEVARRVIWLNPEPARQWNTGDSVAGHYSEIVDMHECRNLEQLRQFVLRTMPV